MSSVPHQASILVQKRGRMMLVPVLKHSGKQKSTAVLWVSLLLLQVYQSINDSNDAGDIYSYSGTKQGKVPQQQQILVQNREDVLIVKDESCCLRECI